MTYRFGSRDETTLPGKTVRDHFSEERFATGSHNFSLSLGEFLSVFDVSLATGFLIGITSQEILSDVSNLSMPRARQERNYQMVKEKEEEEEDKKKKEKETTTTCLLYIFTKTLAFCRWGSLFSFLRLFPLLFLPIFSCVKSF